MGNFKFITQKGSSSLGTEPYYVGTIQHERSMSKKETYAYLENRMGYTKTKIEGAFRALAKTVRNHADAGNVTVVNDVVTFRPTVKGSFEGLNGPWTKGVNWLQINGTTADAFRNALSGVTPTNNTAGAKPTINTVLDETTSTYDVIVAGDTVTIAGSDLAPDSTQADEYVAFTDAKGNTVKAEISASSLQSVTVKFATAPAQLGSGTLVVMTRSGLGTDFGVREAKRIVTFA